MKGVILGFDAATLKGAIRAEDGTRYEFSTAEWKTPGVPPRAGMQIDFEPSGGNATGIYAAGGAGPAIGGGGGAGGDIGKLFLTRPPIAAAILMIVGCFLPIIQVSFMGLNLFTITQLAGAGGSMGALYYLLWAVPVLAAIVLYYEFAKQDTGAPANLRLASGAAGAGGIILLFLIAMSQVPAGYGAMGPSLGIGAFIVIGGGVLMLLHSFNVVRSFGGGA